MTPAPDTSASDREVVESLSKALAATPARQDLRLRLLRLHFVAGRAQAFVAEAQNYKAQQATAASQSEWHVVAEMGRVLMPDSPLFKLENDFTVAWDYDDGQVARTATKIQRFGETASAQQALDMLTRAYEQVRADSAFLMGLDIELTRLARPTPLHLLPRLSAKSGGARIFLKREDLAAPDTRLSIHVIGQALLAQRLGKSCLVTGSVDGRVGVAVASIAARLGMQAQVFMDSEQHQRQVVNVQRMQFMGAQVHAVKREHLADRDIREIALDHWLAHERDCFMVCGLTAGPRPYSRIAEDLSAMIGRECRRQLQAQAKRAPDMLFARAGENTDAIGFFAPFIQEKSSTLVCVQPAEFVPRKDTADNPFAHSVQLSAQQKQRARAILEGMEYSSVRREHEVLRATGRVEYLTGNVSQGLAMIHEMGHLEGMTPAPETAQVLAAAFGMSQRMKPEQAIIVMYAEQPDKAQLEIGALATR